MDSVDFKASRGLFALAGGDLASALGGELRKEKQTYHQSDALAQDLILGESSQGPAAAFGHSRKVGGVFAEISAPVTKQLEVQAALRCERYQVTGSATSPKLGLKYLPSKALLLRASVGAGFRAPSLSDLYRPINQGSSATLVDPVCLAADPGNTVTDCSDIWTHLQFSNAKLKPERSRQFSLGAVLEPQRGMNISVDYWNIKKTDLISTIGVDRSWPICPNTATWSTAMKTTTSTTSIWSKTTAAGSKSTGSIWASPWPGLRAALAPGACG